MISVLSIYPMTLSLLGIFLWVFSSSPYPCSPLWPRSSLLAFLAGLPLAFVTSFTRFTPLGNTTDVCPPYSTCTILLLLSACFSLACVILVLTLKDRWFITFSSRRTLVFLFIFAPAPVNLNCLLWCPGARVQQILHPKKLICSINIFTLCILTQLYQFNHLPPSRSTLSVALKFLSMIPFYQFALLMVIKPWVVMIYPRL